MKKISTLLGSVFGYIMLALALIVTAETVGRKLLSFSLQGADELGGYALAVGSSLCFTVALLERGHIRIDLLLRYTPRRARAVLDWLSILLIAAFAVLLVWVCTTQLVDSAAYGSTAATPWATPLVWPQSLWVAGLAVFMVAAVAMAAHATLLLLTGRMASLERAYGPKVVEEEVREELEDLAGRR